LIMPPKPKSPIAVTTTKHRDKRTNIPTKELRGFVADDEAAPPKILYPRDPSLDPQLVWKGKDEQDASPLEVPAVPIYIQEKIHPQAIVENVRKVGSSRCDDRTAQRAVPTQEQIQLFSDFNGIKFEELIDFYHHTQNWSNRFILGDSLLAMTSLAEKEALKGKVQMIYFDPPYGINFGSNWQVSTRKRDVKDGKAEDATRQPEQIRAFRDTWKLGIHSYLSYLRDRLTAARELLTESGSVFVQIGDENVHLVRSILDEVFGSENFCGQIVFATTTGRGSTLLGQISDYIVWYAKSKAQVKYRQLYLKKEIGEAGATRYDFVELEDGTRRRMAKFEKEDLQSLGKDTRFYSTDQITSAGETVSGSGPIEFAGKKFQCPTGLHWKTTIEGMKRLMTANRIVAEGSLLRYVRFLDDFSATPLNSIWPDIGGVQSRTDPKVYVVQTSTTAIQRCLLMTTDPGDLVLDPTCGSGTTAYVAEQWGRRWITMDTSRVAIALARTRLMAARFPYYLLADSPEGVRKEMEASGKIVSGSAPAPGAAVDASSTASSARGKVSDEASDTTREARVLPGKFDYDIKKGFVYNRVPHVTLKSIANNPDIQPGMSREAIDAAIRKHADTELLYDDPFEDKKRIRVTGPFTVESLSPHRVLAADAERPASEAEGQKESPVSQFTTMILENLKSAGVQNTRKGERLKFDLLEPFAGVWLNASGSYTENGKSRRVAISIGPEHGTVSPEQVREAAKEAVQGVGFDLLVVCGFAFDPHVSEETKRYGKLQVVAAHVNPDLAMADELLKKTGAGNLFMVFGEVDLEIKEVGRVAPRAPGGSQRTASPIGEEIVVEIKGLDVYDPTTGQIRNSKNTDDIACWFIDTDYNGESFFVREAYFTGADEPYEKLKRALRAEIDEVAWQTLYSTTSRPFPKPKTGKIAVKVINHYGDEVLKVCEVE
jgi:adenine-specific DNA-methyltransferase